MRQPRNMPNGPAQGLADTKVGTFTQALYDESICRPQVELPNAA